MSAPTPTSPNDPFAEAKRLARKLHRPVYIVDGEVTATKPGKPATTVWPAGTVTVGNPDAAARDIERKLIPRAPAA